MTPVDLFLARLRASHPDMVTIFTEGSCWELYEIMRVIWPQAEPWYCRYPGHVYVRIDGVFYDIRGRARKLPCEPRKMTTREGWPGDAPHRWSKRTYHRVSLTRPTMEPAQETFTSVSEAAQKARA